MRFLSADAIFDGLDYLERGAVLVLDERQAIEAILPPNSIEPGRVEQLQGCLLPGFVNAHGHLELSHMKGRIEQGKGFPAFARQLIQNRFLTPEGEMLEHMQDADRYMYAMGIVAAGDICNTPLSVKVKTESKLFYHSFIELISLDPSKAGQVMEEGKRLLGFFHEHNLSGSLAPHAPYSVSRELLQAIARHCRETASPSSIHNQESKEEIDFLCSSSSEMEDLFAFLNINLSFYKAPGKAGLELLKGLMPEPCLLVHNTYSSQTDIELSRHIGLFWCFCPRANVYIENTVPKFDLFKDHDTRICLGTDSLASNTSLDLTSEANGLLASGSFETKQVLRALTYNGALALGLEQRFGRLKAGTRPGINRIVWQSSEIKFMEKIA